MFVLLVADPSTRSWRRRSKSTNSCSRQNNTFCSRSDSTPSAKLGHDRNPDAPEEDTERLTGTPGSFDPCPLTAWCHKDAYVRMSWVKYSNDPKKKYSNDPKKAKDRVRPVIIKTLVARAVNTRTSSTRFDNGSFAALHLASFPLRFMVTTQRLICPKFKPCGAAIG